MKKSTIEELSQEVEQRPATLQQKKAAVYDIQLEINRLVSYRDQLNADIAQEMSQSAESNQ